MKALVFHKQKNVKVENVKDPALESSTDVIVKVTSTAICGSDLHIVNGFLPQKSGLILGHEFMGIVEEVGKHVKNLKKGDRIIVPFPIACGQCFFCKHGLSPHCENSNPNYGPEGGQFTEKGGGLFGYTDLYGGYNGGQAEYVRVPYADVGPYRIENNLKDEELLFLTDIFPTGWTAVDWANLQGGETVVVFGCGPVGIMVQKSAWLKGAGRVIGIDVLDYRLEFARRTAGSEPLNFNKTNVITAIREMTNGRGADVCIDAVGMEAQRNMFEKMTETLWMEGGTIKIIDACVSAVRRGGTISIIGVYGTPYSSFPLGQIFDKGLTLKTGQALVHKHLPELLSLVENKKIILDDIITHSLPLSEAAHGYKIFNDKEDNCLKVVLKP